MKARVLAASLALAATLGAGVGAQAAPVIGLPNDVAINQLQTERGIELTLKYPAPSNPYNELMKGQRSADQLGGISFKFQRVTNIDLSTMAGWEAASKVDTKDVKEENLTDGFISTTDGNGEVAVTLPMGVYLVTEQPNNQGFVTAAPFLIALPAGDPVNGEWRYKVSMTPKIEFEPDDDSGSEPPSTPKNPPSNPPTEPGTPPDEPGNPPTTPVFPPHQPPFNPPTTPPSTPPGTPNNPPSTPPGTPGTTDTPWLPNTGAGVLGIMGAGMALMVMGIILVSRKRKEEEAA